MKQMKLGYFFTDGERYGDFFHEANSHTNLYCTGLWEHGDIEALLAGLRRARDYNKTLMLQIDVNFDPKWQETLRAVLLRGPSLDYISLADEPNWGEREAEMWATRIRGMLPLNSPIKLGVTLDTQRVDAGQAWYYGKTLGYDWLGITSYLRIGSWWAEEASAAVRVLTLRLWENAPRSVEKWVIGQAYDRNGAFGPFETLNAIQIPTYKVAKEVGATGLIWFSLGRPGGTATYRRLMARHKEIARREGVLR